MYQLKAPYTTYEDSTIYWKHKNFWMMNYLNDEVIKGEFWQSSIKIWGFPGAAQLSFIVFKM